MIRLLADRSSSPTAAPRRPQLLAERRGSIRRMTTVDRLYLTGNESADRLLATSALALLIGFALDQQVTVQKAFSGPLDLRQRLGHLDAARIAAMEPGDLDRIFRERPALHRFPGAMAAKVAQLCGVIAGTYGNDASRIWTEATDGRDLRDRLQALPGFGDMKVRGVIAVLHRRLDVSPPGIESVMPTYPTLGDVDSAEALAEYQARKRAYKAELRAAGKSFTA